MIKRVKRKQLMQLIKEEIIKFNQANINESKTVPVKQKQNDKDILKSLIKECLIEVFDKTKKTVVKEGYAHNDYDTISELLTKFGWAYSDAYGVRNKETGQEGTRYVLEPYPRNLNGVKPVDINTLKAKMTEILGQENVLFSPGRHRQAPEITNMSMVVLGGDNYDEE